MMIAILGLFGITLFAVLIRAFYFLDRLVRHEYHFHREAWERDGCPASWIFWPPESWWLVSGIAFQRCAFAWLFYTPKWTSDDPSAKALLSRVRWHVLLWNVGIITFLLLMHACGVGPV
jgi:hypothetical protein